MIMSLTVIYPKQAPKALYQKQSCLRNEFLSINGWLLALVGNLWNFLWYWISRQLLVHPKCNGCCRFFDISNTTHCMFPLLFRSTDGEKNILQSFTFFSLFLPPTNEPPGQLRSCFVCLNNFFFVAVYLSLCCLSIADNLRLTSPHTHTPHSSKSGGLGAFLISFDALVDFPSQRCLDEILRRERLPLKMRN